MAKRAVLELGSSTNFVYSLTPVLQHWGFCCSQISQKYNDKKSALRFLKLLKAEIAKAIVFMVFYSK